MRVGILTLPLHTNYGGILQAYALQTVLERMGHEVHIIEEINFPLRLSLWKKPLSYGKRIVKNILGRKCIVLYEQKYNKEQPIIRQYTDQFINQYIHIAKYEKFSTIMESEYDAIVVGSDQVWRPKYFGYNQIENAYLKFAKDWNIKRIAYAASFGTDEWEYTFRQTQECKSLVKKFDAVSVREISGVDLCKVNLEINAQHVLDPTLLLERDDYVRLFEEKSIPRSEGTLLNYILDETPEKDALIKNVANSKSLIPFRVNSKVENSSASLFERIQPSVESWLRGFYDAKFVITDSFHACVFSILFKKQFVVCGNEERGLARLKSLLSILGLENRLITAVKQLQELQEIDFDEVYKKLDKLKNTSWSFLYEMCQN